MTTENKKLLADLDKALIRFVTRQIKAGTITLTPMDRLLLGIKK